MVRATQVREASSHQTSWPPSSVSARCNERHSLTNVGILSYDFPRVAALPAFGVGRYLATPWSSASLSRIGWNGDACLLHRTLLFSFVWHRGISDAFPSPGACLVFRNQLDAPIE